MTAGGSAGQQAPAVMGTDRTKGAPNGVESGTDVSPARHATDAQEPTGDVGAEPRIVAALPNPVADGDATEFVVLDVPPDTRLDRLSVGDDDGRSPLPNVVASGRVAVTTAPAAVRPLTDVRVVGSPELPALANGHERLRLYENGTVVDDAVYRDAPASKVARWSNGTSLRWEPLGATDRPVVHGGPEEVRAFVLPDAENVVVETLREADRRILLAGYTFASDRVADALVAARKRNVTVRVLLAGNPVGGLTSREATLLDRLAAAGVDVRLLAGPRRRYAYHHAKYAVIDDRALVTTENFKPSGTGGQSNRGWGVVVEQSRVIEGLVETFRADAGWVAATDWQSFRRGRTFARSFVANGSYGSGMQPKTVTATDVELLVAPDNAERRVVSLLDDATESIDVIQMSIDGRRGPFLRATLRAARRGVKVRILLSSASYVREENERLVEWLDERAAAENLPLDAKLATPAGRYETIHAKGVVVDDRRVLVGSLNWNAESMRRNREVLVLLEGKAVANYYGRVFEGDWNGDEQSVPGGVLAAAGGCLVVAALVARRLDFE